MFLVQVRKTMKDVVEHLANLVTFRGWDKMQGLTANICSLFVECFFSELCMCSYVLSETQLISYDFATLKSLFVRGDHSWIRAVHRLYCQVMYSARGDSHYQALRCYMIEWHGCFITCLIWNMILSWHGLHGRCHDHVIVTIVIIIT